ncbi:hypothetical protein DPSP01_004944 [Paraphaeosphaeria sporulosa]
MEICIVLLESHVKQSTKRHLPHHVTIRVFLARSDLPVCMCSTPNPTLPQSRHSLATLMHQDILFPEVMKPKAVRHHGARTRFPFVVIGANAQLHRDKQHPRSSGKLISKHMHGTRKHAFWLRWHLKRKQLGRPVNARLARRTGCGWCVGSTNARTLT